ncbi:GTP cyclohydrolase FolE2 [Natronospirillum operosum]|uniref:GTP cyclohydrolase FolE2 n=1 Tax=Natronospirillum operosum TaxID=2759953 RepID=UPI001F0D2CC2|nr:GTP cyclohydrolase FolE2 [Natronospirillum operosum]
MSVREAELNRLMPDVAEAGQPVQSGALDWVGMNGISLPLHLKDAQSLAPLSVQAKMGSFVSLDDPNAKGIHMSRLYLAQQDMAVKEGITPQDFSAVLEQFIDSHEGLSERAHLTADFELVTLRPSLKSGKQGYKAYPGAVRCIWHDGSPQMELEINVPYSSTCPCSAALSRQLIQDGFREQFGAEGQVSVEDVMAFLGTEEGISATPHSQRSNAQVKIKVDPTLSAFPFLSMIDAIEAALNTPVQTAVKREDEQEFARLNAANLMFCEDAARRVTAILNQQPWARDFWLRVDHYESLHAHDAVAINSKGIKGGYQPI